MNLVYQCCAGLDVHKKSVSACIRIQQGEQTRIETALFGTFTADLERLRDWLQQYGVQQIAMESTGVFWMPVWNVLERDDSKRFELTLINPQHVHALPGRKTDQRDCRRIAELHQYGLLRSSFIPPAPVRELRDLTRRRTHLQGERNRVLNRIRRLLETANIKLGSVVSDISGKTAMLIMAEIVRGNCDPASLSELAQASLKNKKAELMSSLHGFYSDHFQWLLGQALHELRYLDKTLDQVDRQLAKHLRPHADLVRRLCTIPGVDFTTAAVILAEVGFDMTRFADAAQLASWAGLCPGNNESAGKRFSSRTRKGNRYLRRAGMRAACSRNSCDAEVPPASSFAMGSGTPFLVSYTIPLTQPVSLVTASVASAARAASSKRKRDLAQTEWEPLSGSATITGQYVRARNLVMIGQCEYTQRNACTFFFRSILALPHKACGAHFGSVADGRHRSRRQRITIA